VPGQGGLDTGAMLKPGALDLLINLGADEIDVPAGPFTIYIGSHGDRGAHRADVVLPAAAYTEKSATYVNTEGRVQMTARATFPPGDAREDWSILRALSAKLGKPLPYDNLAQLRSALYKSHPHLAAIDEIAAAPLDLGALARLPGSASSAAFVSPVKDPYLTNAIARASAVMAECSALRRGHAALAAE
jgi:NADH-quinone oxidoreductase subunit G